MNKRIDYYFSLISPWTYLGAVWAEERKIAEPATLEHLIDSVGMNGAAVLKAVAGPDVAAAYAAEIEAALRRGVFGAPTYVYRDELFWGQHRLEFLDRALAR